MTTPNPESEKKVVPVPEKPKESVSFNAPDRIYQRFEEIANSPEATVEIRIQAAEKAIKELQDLISFSVKRASEKIKSGPEILAGAAARSGGTPDTDIADKLKASCSSWLERAQNLEFQAKVELGKILSEKFDPTRTRKEVIIPESNQEAVIADKAPVLKPVEAAVVESPATEAKAEVVEKIDIQPMLDFLKAFGLPASEYAATTKKTSEQLITENFNDYKRFFEGVIGNWKSIPGGLRPPMLIVDSTGKELDTFAKFAEAMIASRPKDRKKIKNSYIEFASAVGGGGAVRSLAGAEPARRSDLSGTNPEASFQGRRTVANTGLMAERLSSNGVVEQVKPKQELPVVQAAVAETPAEPKVTEVETPQEERIFGQWGAWVDKKGRQSTESQSSTQPEIKSDPEKTGAALVSELLKKLQEMEKLGSSPEKTAVQDKLGKMHDELATKRKESFKDLSIEELNKKISWLEGQWDKITEGQKDELQLFYLRGELTAAQELLKEKEGAEKLKKDIAAAKNFDELLKVIEASGGIQGRTEFFTPEELKERISLVRNGSNIDFITHSGGLKEKVSELIKATVRKSQKIVIERPVEVSPVAEATLAETAPTASVEEESSKFSPEALVDIALVGNEVYWTSLEEERAAEEYLGYTAGLAVNKGEFIRGWCELAHARNKDGQTAFEAGDHLDDFFESTEAAQENIFNFLNQIGLGSRALEKQGINSFGDVLMPVRYDRTGRPELRLLDKIGTDVFIPLKESQLQLYLEWVKRIPPSDRTKARKRILSEYLIPTLEARLANTKEESERQPLEKQLGLLRLEAKFIVAPASLDRPEIKKEPETKPVSAEVPLTPSAEVLKASEKAPEKVEDRSLVDLLVGADTLRESGGSEFLAILAEIDKRFQTTISEKKETIKDLSVEELNKKISDLEEHLGEQTGEKVFYFQAELFAARDLLEEKENIVVTPLVEEVPSVPPVEVSPTIETVAQPTGEKSDTASPVEAPTSVEPTPAGEVGLIDEKEKRQAKEQVIKELMAEYQGFDLEGLRKALTELSKNISAKMDELGTDNFMKTDEFKDMSLREEAIGRVSSELVNQKARDLISGFDKLTVATLEKMVTKIGRQREKTGNKKLADRFSDEAIKNFVARDELDSQLIALNTVLRTKKTGEPIDLTNLAPAYTKPRMDYKVTTPLKEAA